MRTGHRVVKIVKPKNGNQNLYTYYVRDAQGNVLATYERSFAKILDFQNITYAKINDTLVKYTGLSGLAEFSAQYSNIETVRNAYMNHLANNSEFLQTFSPYQFLKDDQNKLDTLLNRIELSEFLNLLFTASPPDFETVCRCLKNRHQMNSNYAPIMRAFVVDSASLMNLFLAMEMTNYGDLIPSLGTRLGFENLDIEEAKNQLCHYVYGNNGTGSNLKRLFDELYIIDEGFRDCGPSVSNFLFKLHTDQPNKLIELLVVIPELRDMFYRTASSDGFDCSYSFSHDDMASLMSNNYPEISWNKLIDAFGTNTILSYFVNNQNSYFMNQAVLYNKSILTNTQQNQNLYGGNYGGLENYFTYIRNYFGQGLYDQITAGFMQQSSVYTDSLRLEEWHLYGSSRIGIYQTNKAMAQRTVRIENGITTQLSNTHIEQLSLSRFYTERGAKRYELTNHLGNVLTVVTDKKLPVCSGTSVSYFIADVVSATDYSPFGAPLAERTWQGSEYRYGFNGKEKDHETYGEGNIYDYGFRVFNPRLGKFLSVDPLTNSYPWYTPYQFAGNKSIVAIDLDGLEEYFVHEYTLRNSFGIEFLYKVDYIRVAESSKVNLTRNTVAVMLKTNLNSHWGRQSEILKEGMRSYNRAQSQAASNDNRIINYSGRRIDALNQNNSLNGRPSSAILLQTTIMNFEADKGINKEQVKTQFEAPSNQDQLVALDNLANALVKDPSLKANVIGFASNTATNIDGTESEISIANNTKLALKRANAGKEYLVDYIKTKLGVTDFDESRITTTNGGVKPAGDDPKSKQAIVFTPTP